MKITKFATSKWMGAPDCEIKPSALTIVSGRNGSGKTSIIESLRYCIGSGHDPSVIRVGEEAATVEIRTDDDTVIKCRVTAKSTTRTITDSQGRKITRSAEYIASIVNALSLDPVAFLDMPPKQQVTTLLHAIPSRLTAQDLAFLPVKVMAGVNLDRHALEVLGDSKHGITGALYQERAEINRLAKDKRATATEMRRNLPEAPAEGNWDQELASVMGELKALQTGTKQRILGVEADARTAVESARDLAQAKKDEIREQAEREIQRVRDEAAARMDRIETERLAVAHKADESRQAALAAIDAEYQPRFRVLNEQIAKAKTMVEAHAKAEQTRTFIDSQESEARKLEADSDKLTKALEKIDGLKARLASELPVPGLEIGEDGLTLGGVPFARVNKARRIQVALSIAKLQSGELPLICIDDLEHLDAESMEAFRQAAEASGLQFVAARVTDADLAVLNA
jgi:hypothetical protein